MRVVERREDFPLARHALAEVGASKTSAGKLQSHRPIDHAVAPLREPDRSHASLTDLAKESIDADLASRRFGGACRVTDASIGHRLEFRDCSEERLGLDARQELAQSGLERLVLGREPVDPPRPVRRSKIERFVEKTVQDVPAIGIHRAPRARENSTPNVCRSPLAPRPVPYV